MKQTLFSKQLACYFDNYLPQVRHCSDNTIASYADGFVIFFRFFLEKKGKKHYQIDYKDITPQTLDEYVLWMQDSLNYSAATQKHRVTAISAFLKYASSREMKALGAFNAVSGALTPKIPKVPAPYFTIEEMTVILHLPDCTESTGIREAALLCVMYDSGARAQEMCDIIIGDFKPGNPGTLRLRGKGNKIREVPISDDTVRIIQKYLHDREKSSRKNYADPLFSSQRSEKMTTASIRYIVQKYVSKAKESSPGMFLEGRYSPHSFRHSKAIHMLKAGVPLIYIRNFLGHESVQTTEQYLRMSQGSAAEILQKKYSTEVIPDGRNMKTAKDDLPEFLKSAR